MMNPDFTHKRESVKTGGMPLQNILVLELLQKWKAVLKQSKWAFFLVFAWMPAQPLSAQQPTDSVRFLYLEEVQIQSYSDIHSKNNRLRRRDGQARTERLLEYLPGLSLISRGNFAQEPVIRGLSDGQIMVTLNGMRISGACTDRMDPATSYIEPNNLKSIRMQAGPGFEAGGATIGGSVNFTLNEPQPGAEKKLKGTLGSGFETNALARQFLGNLQYSGKKFAFYVNGLYRKADNYTPGGDKNDLRNSFGKWTSTTGFSVDDKARLRFSQYQKWNAGFSATYLAAPHHEIHADYIADRGKNIGYPALTMDVAFANADIASVSHRYQDESRRLSSVETKGYYNYINHAMDDTKRPPQQVPMHMDMPGQAGTAGFYSKGLYKINPHQTLQWRLESVVNRWHAEMTMYPNGGGQPMFMLTIPDAQRWLTGMDIADYIHLNDAISLQGGLRLEYNRSSIYTSLGRDQLSAVFAGPLNRGDWVWNAYLSSTVRLGTQWEWNTKIARAMRAPTVKELYSFYLFNRVDGHDYIGYPALKNEAAFNADAGLKFRSPKISGALKGFAYLLQQYIAGRTESGYSAMTIGAKGVKRYDNIEVATIAGAEFSLSWQPLPALHFSTTNTYQLGMDKNKNHLPMMPPFRSVNRADWTHDDWNVFAESVYAATQLQVSAFYGETATPAFNIINAGLAKDFSLLQQKITLSVSGLNIFNQYYTEHLDVIHLPRPGRNFVMHATLYF